MALVTLKSCHTYLKQLENAAEFKRKMPASSNPRTLKEGLYEMTRLLGQEEDSFAHPEQLAALMGGQRFVMIAGEASVTDSVARVFYGSRVLLTVLIDPTHFATPTGGQAGASHQQGVRWQRARPLRPRPQASHWRHSQNLRPGWSSRSIA
ncbi:MAG: hypothetical protein ACYC23_19320 [Limisphaerales bacterium]